MTGPRRLDIDHLAPLAESWDSGAPAWDDTRRKRYANELGDPRALLTVTDRSNCQKSDQDVAEWFPNQDVVCRYIADWTAVDRRWDLTAELNDLTAGCPNKPVRISPAG
ncbi:DUF1524 domain-containing protein [Streptomyces sp. NPDC088746]|uniref:GmrSD restriction endonuclease domain-containing protein n=1 Tax=Streptomyces sp. NPDC088746 TaxID=3365885 RepID=UPI00382F6FA9